MKIEEHDNRTAVYLNFISIARSRFSTGSHTAPLPPVFYLLLYSICGGAQNRRKCRRRVACNIDTLLPTAVTAILRIRRTENIELEHSQTTFVISMLHVV